MKRTYKQIEESRNRRLWVTQVLVPLATAGAALYSNPEIRNNVHRGVTNAKLEIKYHTNKFINKFKKEDKAQ